MIWMGKLGWFKRFVAETTTKMVKYLLSKIVKYQKTLKCVQLIILFVYLLLVCSWNVVCSYVRVLWYSFLAFELRFHTFNDIRMEILSPRIFSFVAKLYVAFIGRSSYLKHNYEIKSDLGNPLDHYLSELNSEFYSVSLVKKLFWLEIMISHHQKCQVVVLTFYNIFSTLPSAFRLQ